jgi:type I restriction enzyme S subunit
MSFPRYPKYKPSGVEWLGEVPEHWDVLPIKRDLDFMTSGSRGWAENYSDDGELFIRIGNLTRDGIGLDLSDVQRVLVPAGAEGARTKVQKGDVLFSVTAYLGSVAVVPDDLESAYVSQHIALVRLRQSRFSPRWVAYGSLSIVGKTWFETKAYGGTKIQVSLDDVEELLMTAPPLAEQIQIASFLDRETAKIDGLVGEQRRLIELLKEKRQAVISHAVTKGLNPHAPLKPSGIEWLGDVPEHWEVLPLKRIVAVPITDGPHETPQFFDEGVPFVSAEAVSSGRIDFSRVRACISEEDNARYSMKYSPKLHDIYMVKSGATTGVTAIVEDRTDFNIWSPLAVIRCGEEAVPHFVLNFMRSRNFLEAVSLNWSFGTQQNIGMGVIEDLACTVPSVEEQSEIAQFLNQETAKLDALTAEAERGIELLQERRTALISAAVTGKIDVRGLAGMEAL